MSLGPRRRRRPRRGAVVAALAVLALGVGCSNGDGGRTELVVLAAASLTDAFGEIEVAFEAANPDVDVVATFDASSTLATQVAEGAPADVLATADEATMATAADSGAVAGEPVRFAANTGVLARPVGNDTVSSPEDLADGEVVLAVCAPQVPCGVVATELFAALGIEPTVDSEEENVAAVLTKLGADEVDAGVIYVTDDLASDAVEAVPLPDDVVVGTDYPIAAVSDADAATAFVDFVTGPRGQAILGAAGFVVP